MAPGRSRRRDGTQPTDGTILKLAGLVLAGFLVVGGVLFVTSLRSGGTGDADPPLASTTPTPSSLPTRALTTSAEPSPEPSRTTAGPTAEGMRTFVRGYLSRVSADPAAGWQELTAKFRTESGGFSRYRDFWGNITRAEPRGIFPDPHARTVAYSVDYTLRDGTKISDRTRLRLVLENGTYRIDGEG